MQLEHSRQIFEKYSNINIHANLSSGSQVVPHGHAKLNITFCNFADMPDIYIHSSSSQISLFLKKSLVFPTHNHNEMDHRLCSLVHSLSRAALSLYGTVHNILSILKTQQKPDTLIKRTFILFIPLPPLSQLPTPLSRYINP